MSKSVNPFNFQPDDFNPMKWGKAHRLFKTASSNRPTIPTLLKTLYLGVALGAVSVPAYACNIPKSYYSNVFCTADSDYFLALKDSGQPVALINKKGRRVADLTKYNAIDVSKLQQGLVPVQRLGRVGYINTSGIEVIPAIYQVIKGNRETKGWSRAVNDNRIVVKKNGKFGVIDTRNRTIVPFSSANRSISDFNNSRAFITTANGKKWIDINGNPVADPTVARPKPSVKAAKSIPADSPNERITASAPQLTEPRVIEGNLSNPNTFTRPSISEPKEVWSPEKRDRKWGFVDRNNVPMIKFLFDQVTPFSEGLAGVRMEDKWGFVNLAGELVIPFEYKESELNREKGPSYKGKQPFQFIDGKSWVANTDSGAKICINTEGKYVNCN